MPNTVPNSALVPKIFVLLISISNTCWVQAQNKQLIRRNCFLIYHHFISVFKPTVIKYLYLFCFVLLCFIFGLFFFFPLFPLVMGIKLRASCMLGTHSITELYYPPTVFPNFKWIPFFSPDKLLAKLSWVTWGNWYNLRKGLFFFFHYLSNFNIPATKNSQVQLLLQHHDLWLWGRW